MNMEGNHAHWNPGIGGSVTSVTVAPPPPQSEVWPQMQPECLMNTADPSMFGYPNLVLSSDGSHRLTEFRHRFPHAHSSIHFTNSVLGGHGHHDNLDLTHPLVDVPDSETNSSVQTRVQDSQPLGMELNNSRHHDNDLDECTDDCSDEDEEEDSEDDSEMHTMDGSTYVHSLSHNPSMAHTSLTVEEASLPSCQQHSHQLRISSNNEVGMLGNGLDEPSCHQKNGMMSEIPPINQGHPLNSNPISAIPMITGSCNSMMMSDEQEVVRNAPSQSQNTSSMMNSDPSICTNNGQSVHGKLYVEERVVFHLKQWTDSGFGNFNSCREQEQQKSQLYQCAVCQLQTPHNSLQQKDTHRHPVRGVLISFEDCIILELYPEDYMDETRVDCRTNNSLDPKHSLHVDNTKEDHPMEMSYFNSASTSLVVEPNESQSMEKSSVLNQEDHNNRGWWDYESERHVDGRHLPQHDNESCAINLKLSAQRYHDAQEREAELTNIHDGLDDHQNLENQVVQVSIVEPIITQMGETTVPNEFHKYNDESSCYDTEKLQQENQEQTVGIKISSDNNESIQVTEVTITEINDDNNSPLPRTSELDNNCVDPVIESVNVNHVDPTLTNKIQEQEEGEIEVNNKHIGKELKTPKQKSTSKYPCPCCDKLFSLKRLLKDHLEENHESGNPFQCKLCKVQYTDSKRLQRHSCTLSVESLKNRLKIKEAKDQEVLERNQNSDSDYGISTESPQAHSSIDEALPVDIIISKSSKIRKFSEKARLKTKSSQGEKPPDEDQALLASKSKLPTEEPSKNLKHQRVSKTKRKGEDTENEIQEDIAELPRLVKCSSTSPIKVNQDQNLDKGVQEEKPIKTKEFKCKACGKYFSTALRLKNHIACHGSEQHGAQCEKCGKRFGRRDKLMRHMFVHSEEKLFSCDVCDKRFSRLDKKRDHLKSHQSEVIYCSMCSKTFNRPDIYRQHVKLHLMKDKHQCVECLRFVSGPHERLAQHMKRHQESKAAGQTLVCPLCTKYFIQQQSLKAHIRKFHPDALEALNLNNYMEFSTNEVLEDGDTVQENAADESSNSSNSNSGSPPSSSLIEPFNDVDKNTTTVCKVLKTVMSSSKSKHKQASKIVAPKKTKFECTICSATFSRKQDLKNHELIKHSETQIQINTSDSILPLTGVKSSNRNEVSSNNLNSIKIKSSLKTPFSLVMASKSQANTKSGKGSSKHKSKNVSSSKSSLIIPTNLPHQQLVPISFPSTSSPGLSQISQQPTLKLPSCASLTSDLSFNLNHPHPSPYQHPQLQHISAYSHLALSMVGAGRGISVQNIQHPGLVSTSSVESVLVNSQLMHGQSSSSLICPSNASYVINYPTIPYHDQ